MEKNSRARKSMAVKDDCEEVSSNKWEYINMTQQEEDLIYRMYRLVGDKWGLIAGRIPGRTAEEIERFWLMRHEKAFAERSSQKK
ncbi:hypothetical protein J5N97_004556 [Dioscorea zingiberensis]|uniref:Myb-like domain-containing protein n=1 Tax=Dioscorea zingiberensis TaxID=325984 RepID=A0A9D5D8R4_9LILI|nr:hypothetical protein J5N97_004556 [Dioscorea zingiberensis]